MSLFNSRCVTDYLVQNCRPISTSEFAPKGPVDIEIHDGVIDRIVPAGDGDSGSFDADQQYDADGRVVSPTLVEPHTHLFSASKWTQNLQRRLRWRILTPKRWSGLMWAF